MATPMTANQLIVNLKLWGIPYKEYKNWETHNRNHKGPWGPVHGLMIHHTGSDNPDQRELLHEGLVNLPGPLSQTGLDQNGVVHLIGNGRCNHAGMGDENVLQAVIEEDYDMSKNLHPTKADVDGNARFYGMEIWHDGTHSLTSKQLFTLKRFSAMTCSHHKWDARSVIGHGEWQPGKWDPGYLKGKIMDMGYLRGNIQKFIDGGPKKNTVLIIDKKPDTPVDPPKKPPVVIKPKTVEQRLKELETRVTNLEKR